MGGLLSKNVVTPREFADRKAVFPRPGRTVLRYPLSLPTSHPRARLYSSDRTFCSFGVAPISWEKLTPDLRGVTRIGFTYLLTRRIVAAYRYYAHFGAIFHPGAAIGYIFAVFSFRGNGA